MGGVFKKIGREASRPIKKALGTSDYKSVLPQFQKIEQDYRENLDLIANNIETLRNKQLFEQSKVDETLNAFRKRAEILISKEKDRLDVQTAQKINTIKLVEEISTHGSVRQSFLTRLIKSQPKSLISR